MNKDPGMYLLYFNKFQIAQPEVQPYVTQVSYDRQFVMIIGVTPPYDLAIRNGSMVHARNRCNQKRS